MIVVHTYADVDECVDAAVCHPNATCMNVIGSFGCLCGPGFTGDGVTNCTGKQLYVTI